MPLRPISPLLPILQDADVNSVSAIRALVSVNERCRTTVAYRSYKLIYSSERLEDDFSSEMLRIRRKVTVQMTDQIFSKNSLFSMINYSKKYTRACDASRSRKVVTVWIFNDFPIRAALAAIKAIWSCPPTMYKSMRAILRHTRKSLGIY